MRKSLNLVILLALGLLTIPARSQDRVKEIQPEWRCNYFGGSTDERIYTFSSDKEAEAAIDRILRQIGLARNFVIKAATVPNAEAVIQGSVRYILYSQEFIRNLKGVTKTDWSALSIVAHELGHHLQGHTLYSGGSRPPIELEADKFSGFVLYKMGATLEQAQVAMVTLGSERGSATHPGKRARLAAIESGWTEARDLEKPNSNPSSEQRKPRPLPTDPSDSVLDVLKNTLWLEHNVTLGGEPVYLEFESGGRVRSRTPSDPTGYVPVNKKWYLNGDTLYVQLFDTDPKTPITENKGIVRAGRIEGTHKNLSTGLTIPWLLTRVRKIAQ